MQGPNLNYLNCNKGGLHEDQKLNMVCLHEYCFSNPLCCCTCIEEFHQGHTTKTLKKLVIEANELANSVQKQNQNAKDNKECTFNPDIMSDVINQNESKTLESFQQLRASFNATLAQIQQGLKEYYKNLRESLQRAKNKQSVSQILNGSVSKINQAKQSGQMIAGVQKIILQFNKVDPKGQLHKINNSQQSVVNLVNRSNQQIDQVVGLRLNEMRKILVKSSDFIFDSTMNINSLWERELYSFSPQNCIGSLEVVDSTRIRSLGDCQYQMALMQPSLEHGENVKVFRFRIVKLSSNWIGLGVAHKKTVEKKNFIFNYSQIGHGAYMISANGGTWSSTTPELNNRVKAFMFEQGDIITCIINNKEHSIMFVKEVPLIQLQIREREVYELTYRPQTDNPIHPCVTLFYQGNQIQYLPATNIFHIPKYEYLFSQINKHPQIRITNGRLVRCQGAQSEYRACLLNKTIEQGIYNTTKVFSFRIVTSSADWVAVGMCHHKIAATNNYCFNYSEIGHGYYMISSNGGVWSHINDDNNNVVAAFTFSSDDVVDCIVQFGQGGNCATNKITFRLGKKQYSLNFKCVAGDKLYPCVMLHYKGDEVSVLPNF